MRTATKDNYERDQDEAERLVRPAPKQKPPRHDLRRERVEEDDPDRDADKDASLAARVARRFLGLSQDQRVPAWNKTDKVMVMVSPRTLKENPGQYEPYDADKHEAPESEGKPEAPNGEDAPKDKEAPKGEADYAAAGKELYDQAKKDPILSKVLKQFANPKNELKDAIEDSPDMPLTALFGNREFPGGLKTIKDLFEAARSAGPAPKEAPKAEAPKSEEPPKGAESKGEESPKGDAPKNPEPPKSEEAPKSSEPPKSEEPPKGEAPPKSEAPKSEAPPKSDAPKGDEPKSEAPKSEEPPKSEAPKSDAAPKEEAKPEKKTKIPEGAPPPPEEDYTEEDYDEAMSEAMDNLPLHMIGDITAANLHPNEIREIVKQHTAFLKHPMTPSSRASFIQDARGSFSLDPLAVRPPTLVGGVPFDNLDPDKKAAAMQQHRMKVFTKSLIARDMMVDSFGEAGIPPDLALGVADFHLRHNPAETSQERDKRAKEAADDVFEQALSSGKLTKISEGKIRAAFKLCGTDDSAVSRLITSYYQANDYHLAKEKFLSSGSDDSFTEHSTPKEIINGLLKSDKFFAERAKSYPPDAIQHDMARAFKTRVLARLKTVDPDKYRVVRDEMAARDAEQYKKDYPQYVKDFKQWQRDKAKYDKAQAKAKEKFDKEQEQYENDLAEWKHNVQMYYEVAQIERPTREKLHELPALDMTPPKAPVMPDLGLEPREPPKPPMPLGYVQNLTDESEIDKVRKTLWDPKTEAAEAEKARKEQARLEAEVARKERLEAAKEEARMRAEKAKKTKTGDFIYPRGTSMKTAVYNGIAPYHTNEAYVPWTQAQQRDITAADLDLILKEARSWLQQTVLKENYEGAPRDAQLRAALDLAIRTTKDGFYSVGFPPPVYEDLLRRLAGVGNTGTLLTVATSAYNPGGEQNAHIQREANMSIKLAAKTADTVLARLDHIAGQIEKKYAQMGIPFEVAKAIVNDLDRVADEVEVGSFGEASFQRRQAEVIQRDADEGYMDTFKNPMAPIQTDADEPYMSAYKDDQTSAVNHGQSTTGRPLAP
jgi:hypothetical protein